VATEHDDVAPGSPLEGRAKNARMALRMAARGVRSSAVRLPRSVHGEGDHHGFIPRLIGIAREKGVSGYVGDGSSRWPAVHVLDTAHLFRLALEQAPAGSVLHTVGDEGVPIRDIAATIGRHLDLPAASLPAEDFGFLGMLLTAAALHTLHGDPAGGQPEGGHSDCGCAPSGDHRGGIVPRQLWNRRRR
jgi:nucleoside-diphosphate-sugar epimerase